MIKSLHRFANVFFSLFSYFLPLYGLIPEAREDYLLLLFGNCGPSGVQAVGPAPRIIARAMPSTFAFDSDEWE